MSVTIKQVSTRKDLRLFTEFPNRMYKGNPYYVPTLAHDDMDIFRKDRNASFEFCQSDCFLAYKDGKLAGRVCAIINPRANDKWGGKCVRFGWIDFIDDPEVSRALLDTVSKWGKDRGMEHIEGPLGFTDFDTEGMLVEGFDKLGTMVTFYNHPYYKEHMESLGFTKAIDWQEFRIQMPDAMPERYVRLAEILMEKYKLHPLHVNAAQLKKTYGRKVFDLINRTYCVLYGYSFLSQGQIDQYINTYLGLLDVQMCSFIVDEKDDIVAFGVSIPSMSKALQKCGGHYLPFGWYHLLKALKFRHSDTFDMLLVAVQPDLQQKGVASLLFYDMIPRLIAKGYKYAESNPELETNKSVQNLWTPFNHECHKRRRIYEKDL